MLFMIFLAFLTTKMNTFADTLKILISLATIQTLLF